MVNRLREAQVALGISWFALACLCLQASVSLLNQPDVGVLARVVGVLLTVAVTLTFVQVQVLVVDGRRPPWLPWVSAAAVVFAVALLSVYDWAMLGVVIALVMILMPGVRGLAAGVGVYVVGVAAVLAGAGDPVSRLAILLASLLAAGVLYTLTRLVVVLHQLRATQEQVARLEVDEERTRISRDLHDILGRTLVAVSLRQQAALRLIDRDTALAREQLQAAHETVASGQAQLRSLTSGPTIAGLRQELSSAQALCTRVGISCEVEADEVTERDVQQVAATVVREAVTNMLKHSRPRMCRISVRQEASAIVVTVANDGCPPASEVDARGTGLADLRRRCEALGGSFDAKVVRAGRFRVLARLPHPSCAGIELSPAHAATAPLVGEEP